VICGRTPQASRWHGRLAIGRPNRGLAGISGRGRRGRGRREGSPSLCWRPTRTTSTRRRVAARARRAAAPVKLGEIARYCSAPGYGFRPGSIPASKLCPCTDGGAVLRQRLPCRRVEVDPERRGEDHALRCEQDSGVLIQSDDGEGRSTGRRSRHRQHLLRMDGLRRRCTAVTTDVRGTICCRPRQKCTGCDALQGDALRRSTRSASRASRGAPGTIRPRPTLIRRSGTRSHHSACGSARARCRR